MSSYTAKLNRLKQNGGVKDHPKKISGGGSSITAMARKIDTNQLMVGSDSTVGPRILNNFSLMKRRTGCCDEIVKNVYHEDSGARTLSLGDQLFGTNFCYSLDPYVGKTTGCCGTVKKVAVAQDYSERMRRLKVGSNTQRAVTTVNVTNVSGGPGGPYTTTWTFTWDPVPNGEVYRIEFIGVYDGIQTFEIDSPTSGKLYTNDFNDPADSDRFVVYARIKGCKDIVGFIGLPKKPT